MITAPDHSKTQLPKQLQFILGMKDGSPSLWPEGFLSHSSSGTVASFYTWPHTGPISPALTKMPRPVFAAPGNTSIFLSGLLLQLSRRLRQALGNSDAQAS
ncbi:hypothetical protein F2P79_002909 [Pimephales promelas]|nr:hypothetical protein F2P79_002909 [Pimephales promelas]